MKKTNIEVEGGELILMSEEGHYAIIPAKDRSKVKEMINNKSDDSINDYIKYLPKESDYAEDGSLIEGFENPFEPEVSTPDKPIFANEEKGYGEVKKENPIPLNTPYGRQYKNIVEKQEHYNSLSENYGSRVKYREDFLNLYDKPIESGELKKIKYNAGSYNPESKYSYDLEEVPEELSNQLKDYYNFGKELESMEKNWVEYENANEAKEQNDLYSDIYSKKLDLKYAIKDSPLNKIDTLDTQKTTWREVFEGRDDIDNKALMFASLMEEGGNTYDNKDVIDGFLHFGLDRIGENIDDLIDKKYLSEDIKDRIDIQYDGVRNEKGEKVQYAKFANFDDVITMKNAIFNQEKDLILKVAEKEGIELSDEAIEYFTIAGYNGGRGNAEKMLKAYNKEGLLEDNKFLEGTYSGYKRIHENVMRRLDIAKMLKEEGVIK